jgi:hypothetical protein
MTGTAIELTRTLFDLQQRLIVREAMKERRERPDDHLVEYRMNARLQSLAVRGTGYVEHLRRVILDCFEPFNDECRRRVGFTASDAIDLMNAIARLISSRFAVRTNEAREQRLATLRQIKHERRHRNSPIREIPDAVLDLTPTQAKAFVLHASLQFLFADSKAIAAVDASALAAETGFVIDVCQAFLDAFSCPAELFVEEHHDYPTGAHPLTERPGLAVQGGYVFPALVAMTDAIRLRMEQLLQETPDIFDRYLKARGDYLEEESARLLSNALPGSSSWTAMEWRSSEDNSDLDALVTADDVTLRVQCKSGRISAAARRGAPRGMERDIGSLIADAAHQHRALTVAVENEGAVALGFTADQAETFDAPLQFEVIVCLDDVTTWATQAHELRMIDALPFDRPVPWIVSLTDLMAVVDLLDGAQLIHYLVRRQRLERFGRVEAHDELDWVGNYIFEGLFFDRFLLGEDAFDRFRLNTYTEKIDSWYFSRAGETSVEVPKPMQDLPPDLRALITRLESERPSHWTLASIAFLDGDDESRIMWHNLIAHVREKTAVEGWSNASQVFNDRYGLTLFIDKRVPLSSLGTVLVDYATAKTETHDVPNWIAVGEGSERRLLVRLVERDADRSLVDTFVNPRFGPTGPESD